MTTSSRSSKRGSSSRSGSTGSSQQQQQQQQQSNGVIDMALATLQPLRDLSRNWDVDVASWYVRDFNFQSSYVHCTANLLMRVL
jgi:hypothetical protein